MSEAKLPSELQVADSWSKNAKDYAELAKKVPIVQHFSDSAATLLIKECSANLAAGNTFLDVCSGPGTYAITVMQQLGVERSTALEVIITDFSSGMVDAAKDAVHKNFPSYSNVKFDIVDVQNIGMPDNTADVVGCMFGYFVPDRVKAFSEVCRVCKADGGVAVVGTWKYAGFAFIFDEFLNFLGRTEPYNAKLMAHVCADGELLTTELLNAGFTTVTIHVEAKTFEMPQIDGLILALFGNPMISKELSSYSTEFLLNEWRKFLVSSNAEKWKYDKVTNILPVEYVANIAIARK